MGGDDFYLGPILGNAVNLLHSFNDRPHVFYNMAQADEIESILMERIRIAVQVMYNVYALQGFQIKANAPRKFILSAADIQTLFVQADNRLVGNIHLLEGRF